jgi:hypothetical protein
MKKQIIYAKFIPRIFATTIDLFILSFFSSPIMQFISNFLISNFCRDYFILNNIDINNTEIVAIGIQECAVSLSGSNLFYMIFLSFCFNISIMAIYFIGSWIYSGTTIGKILLGIKIVDEDSLEAPSKFNCVKRFFGYFLSFIGIWSILFSKKSQALHDKIANTIVIKR